MAALPPRQTTLETAQKTQDAYKLRSMPQDGNFAGLTELNKNQRWSPTQAVRNQFAVFLKSISPIAKDEEVFPMLSTIVGASALYEQNADVMEIFPRKPSGSFDVIGTGRLKGNTLHISMAGTDKDEHIPVSANLWKVDFGFSQASSISEQDGAPKGLIGKLKKTAQDAWKDTPKFSNGKVHCSREDELDAVLQWAKKSLKPEQFANLEVKIGAHSMATLFSQNAAIQCIRAGLDPKKIEIYDHAPVRSGDKQMDASLRAFGIRQYQFMSKSDAVWQMAGGVSLLAACVPKLPPYSSLWASLEALAIKEREAAAVGLQGDQFVLEGLGVPEFPQSHAIDFLSEIYSKDATYAQFKYVDMKAKK